MAHTLLLQPVWVGRYVGGTIVMEEVESVVKLSRGRMVRVSRILCLSLSACPICPLAPNSLFCPVLRRLVSMERDTFDSAQDCERPCPCWGCIWGWDLRLLCLGNWTSHLAFLDQGTYCPAGDKECRLVT